VENTIYETNYTLQNIKIIALNRKRTKITEAWMQANKMERNEPTKNKQVICKNRLDNLKIVCRYF